jgi:hypothetical protein
MDKYARKREWRPADGPARHNKKQLLAIGRQLPKTFSLYNRDFRLERYLSFLRQEHARLGGWSNRGPLHPMRGCRLSHVEGLEVPAISVRGVVGN